jgi:hypothetical protein
LADTKSRVEDVWKKMNSGLPAKMPKPMMNKLNTGGKETKSKVTNVSNLYGITMLAILCSKCLLFQSSVAL